MATKFHLRCVVCGCQREPPHFFGDHDFEEDFDPSKAPMYELTLGVNKIGGRGRCTWDYEPVSEEVALTLHARLINVTQQLEDYIDAKREKDGLPPLIWTEEQEEDQDDL